MYIDIIVAYKSIEFTVFLLYRIKVSWVHYIASMGIRKKL